MKFCVGGVVVCGVGGVGGGFGIVIGWVVLGVGVGVEVGGVVIGGVIVGVIVGVGFVVWDGLMLVGRCVCIFGLVFSGGICGIGMVLGRVIL